MKRDLFICVIFNFIQACSTEVLMLKTAKRYDPKSDVIVLGNQTTSWSYTRDAYKQAGMGTATDAIFEFAKSMAKMRVDGVEYALLTAISIFSGEPANLILRASLRFDAS